MYSGMSETSLTRSHAMGNSDFGRFTECLVNNAVAFREAQQRGDLLFASVGVELERQPDLPETDRRVFGNAECAAKIEIALGADDSVAQRNVQSGGHGVQRHACAANQSFEQHVGRAGALAVAA